LAGKPAYKESGGRNKELQMKDTPLIVLLTDFSRASQEAFGPTVELARRLKGRIALVHMVQDLVVHAHNAPLAPAISMPPEGIDALVQRAETDLADARKELGSNLDVTTEVLVGERVHEEVCKYADHEDADYIALATHGRTGIRRALMGSVAEAVLRHTDVPVLVYPLAAP